MNNSACVASVGDEYEIDGRLWRVISIGDDQVSLRCSSRAIDEEYTFFEFNAAVYEGDIKIPGFAMDGMKIPDIRFADLSKKVKSEIYRRHAYVKRYATDKNKRSISTNEIVAIVADKLNDTTPPSARTVERWHERWLRFNENWLSFVPRRYLNSVKNRVDPIVDRLMKEAVEEIYLVRDANNTLAAVRDEIESKLNSPQYVHLNEKPPSVSTIKRRIDQVYGPIEVVRHREGEEAAKRLEIVLGEPERMSRILQCVEIDETVADCFVVDEYGIPIGRPTLVLVVDVYSKMILGVYVTFLKPSAAVVLQAIKMAVLPKDRIISEIDGIVGEWPCYGIPESIRTDNIMHYLSDSFDEAMFDLQIEQEQSRVREPRGKASVERKFLTINKTHLNRLPGYVESISNRILETKLDPTKTAILTLEEFNKHLYRWVVNENNYRQCVGAEKRRPIDVWNESAVFYKPRNNRSLESLDVSLLPTVKERTIQSGKGIAFKTTQYSNTELMRLRSRLMGKKKFKKSSKNPMVKFRWNPDDLGYIWAHDPETKSNFKVETENRAYHGLTDPLYKCAKELQKQIREQDGERIDVKEAVCRTRRAFCDMVGGRHKIAEQKRVHATLSKLEKKEYEAPFVESGEDFARSINSGEIIEETITNETNATLNFGDSEYIED